MKKKKIIIITFALIITIAISLFIGTGFSKRTDVGLESYTVSEDNSSITLNIFVASSMGYVRDCNIKQGGDNKYITFYSCFGGLNSSIGAKKEFIVEIEPACTEIYFYHGDGGYTLVLQKNLTSNKWEKVK